MPVCDWYLSRVSFNKGSIQFFRRQVFPSFSHRYITAPVGSRPHCSTWSDLTVVDHDHRGRLTLFISNVDAKSSLCFHFEIFLQDFEQLNSWSTNIQYNRLYSDSQQLKLIHTELHWNRQVNSWWKFKIYHVSVLPSY